MVPLPNLSKLTLDLLGDEGLLYSRVYNETRSSGSVGSLSQTIHESSRTCVITPQGFRAVDADFAPIQGVTIHRPPIEVTESLARFHADFPDPSRLAFVMMRFRKSEAHQRIVAGIREALDPHGIAALRADDKQYHDDLYSNILTYVYGSRFGIAVFERIETEDFNPNVSLEVGFMLGLGKSVCYLKDQTLKTLQTDLVGKLYRTFDPQHPEDSIRPELLAWMDQKGFIARAVAAS
jgi:hypothetical protein